MIDFKDWKKTKEDKLGVEMSHPKGHSLYVMFKGVPLVQREALKRLPLAEGGDVKGVHKSSVEGVERPKNKSEKTMSGESEAGAQVRNEDIHPSGKQKAKDEHNRVLGEMKSMPKPKLKGLAKGGVARYAEGSTEIGKDDQQKDPVESEYAYEDFNADPKVFRGESSKLQPMAVDEDAPSQAAQDSAAAPIQAQDPNAIQTQPPAGVVAPGDQVLADTYGQINQGLNNLQQQQAGNRAVVDKAFNNFLNYSASPESKIDERGYIKSMTLPRQISTGIGMALGGFSVPFGGHNYTADLLNKQIDNNIAAQKENYQHEKNVYGAAHQLFGDDQVATNFAKDVLLEQAKNLTRQAALTNPSPKTAARASALIGGITAQQNGLRDHSAKVLTGKQIQAPQTPQVAPATGSSIPAWQKVGGWFMGLPTANASTGQSNPVQQDRMDRTPPDVPIPQFKVDANGVRRSQFMGAEGNIPNQISPGETGSVNDEMGKAQQFNDKIKLIHQNFGDLWKNRSDANQSLKYLSSLGVNLEGIHIQPPDFTTWHPQSKAYFRAANQIRQELGVLVGNGALTHEQAESVLTNLIKADDTPEDYKNILRKVDGNLVSTIKTPVLEKYGKIKRPKIAD